MKVCIVCGSAAVEQFLDLGSTALANSFLTREDLCKPEPQYPLRVGACHSCGHVQLMETVPPAEMFTDYLYISSASDTLKAHLYDLSDVVVKRHRLGENDLVIDIGCNDGTLLGGFQRHGVRVLGVDPAENLAEMAKNSGVERYVGFFDSQTSKEIVTRWGQASAITATNTFPHIPDLPDFVDGLKTALAPGGVVVLELHYLPDLIEQGAFDTIYHEHVSYWALQPMIDPVSKLGHGGHQCRAPTGAPRAASCLRTAHGGGRGPASGSRGAGRGKGQRHRGVQDLSRIRQEDAKHKERPQSDSKRPQWPGQAGGRVWRTRQNQHPPGIPED